MICRKGNCVAAQQGLIKSSRKIKGDRNLSVCKIRVLVKIIAAL